jgi:biopolymer transport protein ExbB/TolQ
MRKSFPISFEAIYQLFSLMVVIIIVHALYVAVIRPNADAVLARQAELVQQDKSYVAERSVYVLIRDYEQEACFILMFWALAIIAYKGSATIRHRSLLQKDLIPLAEDMRILPEDTRDLSRRIQALSPHQQEALLPRALLAALQRFGLTGNIQDASAAAHAYCTAEGERLESELSIVRYIAWAIPSVGFIGTVRGIGEALGQAHKAVEGEIFGVTKSLGVAFNSTLIALLISIVLMFLVHHLQLLQERYVLDTETYCEEHLTRHLQTQRRPQT